MNERPASPGRELAERFVELAVFAPVGLAVRAREELPRLIETGRARAAARVDIARLIGRIAVEQGRSVLRRGVVGTVDATGAGPAPTARQAAADGAPATQEAGAEPVAAPTADNLAIDHYDSLAAAQVVALLPSLSPGELDDVDRYERAHRNRRTITGKISQLQA